MALPDKWVEPQHLAIYTRILEADAQAAAVLKAFKMKLKGDPSLFEAGKTDGYENMFHVAEEQYLKDPASLDDGRLKRMIFDAWFTPALKHSYDEGVIRAKYPMFNGLQERNPDDASPKSSLTIADLEKIGLCGGEKVNYLTLPGFRSLDDPYYTEGFAPLHHLQLLTLTQAWVKKPLPEQKPAVTKTSVPKPGG